MDLISLSAEQERQIDEFVHAAAKGERERATATLVGVVASLVSGLPGVGPVARELVTQALVAPANRLLDQQIVEYAKESDRSKLAEAVAQSVERLVADDVLLPIIRSLNASRGEILRSIRSLTDDLRNRWAIPLDSGSLPLPPSPSPAAFLQARYEVIPFFEPARSGEMAALEAWCRESPGGSPAVKVGVFTGGGGTGKTRLLIEWARRVRTIGWRAGFLWDGATIEQCAPLFDGRRPTLLVVDYAETKLDLVRSLLVESSRHLSREGLEPLRLVLLGRTSGDWWEEFRRSENTAVRTLAQAATVQAVSSVSYDGPLRAEFFGRAFAAFERSMNHRPSTPPAVDLTDAMFGNPLYIAVMALLSTLDVPGAEGTYASTGRLRYPEILEDILDREEGFWRRGIRDETTERGLRGMVVQARRAVASLTLRGGARSEREAQTVVEQCGLPSGVHFHLLLRDLYPGDGGAKAQDAFVRGLEPDRLGEALVLRALGGEREGSSASIKDLVGTAGVDVRVALHVFTVLGRVAAEHPELVERSFAALLEDGPHFNMLARASLYALRVAGRERIFPRLGHVLAQALQRSGDVGLAKLAESQVAMDSVTLRPVAQWMFARQLESVATDNVHERARLLSQLAWAQNENGQHREAIASGKEAVEIYRRLADTDPIAFGPDLARALTHLGTAQGELEQRRESLASLQEVDRLYGRLDEAAPSAFALERARSIGNVSIAEAGLGMRREALASATEAVRIYRGLVKSDPRVLSDLAAGLTILGQSQRLLGQVQEALESVREAVQIRRELAKANPDVFLPYLVRSINILGAAERELGQWHDALASAVEQVRIVRDLAQGEQTVFLPALAAALTNLGLAQAELGQFTEALVSTEETIRIVRTLAEADPEAFLPELAAALGNLSGDADGKARDVAHEERGGEMGRSRNLRGRLRVS